MTAEAELAATGFIRSLALTCAECHRRNTSECPSCIATAAQRVYRLIVPALAPMEPDTLRQARERRESVLAQLEAANRPLPASEIVFGVCDKAVKSMTLVRMVKTGMIERTRCGRQNFYSIRNKP